MFSEKLKNIGIPVFHQSGWFYGDGVGTKLNYLAVAASGRGNQKLTVGPWDHTDTASRLVDNRDYGAEADVDLQRER
jgi:predicted acyl esterase